MKLSFGSVLATTLWATIAQAQALPNPSGPGSSIPINPDDRPHLLGRPSNHAFSTTGLAAGIPGPFLPNPNDPTRLSLTFPSWGGPPSTFVGE
jgi:hypothetical protein